MALGIKHFAGLVAAGFALVAIWTLPPETDFRETWSLDRAEEVRLNRLERALRDQGEILRRVQWAEALTPRIVEDGTEPAQIILPEAHGLAETQTQRLQAMLDRDIAALTGEPQMRFALAWVDKESGHYPGMGIGGRPRTEYYAGSRDGEAYCLTLHATDPESVVRYVSAYLTDGPRRAPATNLMGLCGWYVEYGTPSASIADWITQGAAVFALERGEAEDIRTYPTRFVFGGRWDRLPIQTQGCQAGSLEACTKVFLDPKVGSSIQQRYERIFEESPLTWSAINANVENVSEFEAYLLHDLATEFGRDAFARFWTSDLPVLEAFEDAFGVTAGEWMVDWMDRTRGVEKAGPGLARSASTGSVLTLMLFLLLAFNAQRRRSVA